MPAKMSGLSAFPAISSFLNPIFQFIEAFSLSERVFYGNIVMLYEG